MTTRTQTRRHWQQRLLLWQRSGLSAAAFCRRHRLALPSFYAWRRKLRQQQPPADAAPSADPPVTFLPVLVQPEPAPPPPPLELLLPQGRCLRIPPGFDRDALRDLLALLEEAPC